MWILTILLFTVPYLWSMRPAAVEEKLAAWRVHARHGLMFFQEKVLSQLPPGCRRMLLVLSVYTACVSQVLSQLPPSLSKSL